MRKKMLLVVHQGALGDFVAIFPAIVRLKKYYPEVDALCQGQLGKLAAALNLVHKWYPLEAAAFSSLHAAETDPRVAEILRSYHKIVLFSLSSQLERSINRLTGNRCLRLPSRPPAGVSVHITTYAIQNLIQTGLLRKKDNDVENFLLPTDSHLQWRQPPAGQRILIHPGSGSKRKRWPLFEFEQIDSSLKTKGLTPEFILGPAESDLLPPLNHHHRTIHVLDDLSDLAALYSAAGGYIGNDSGASHLAAFMGLPVVVIFGPADPARWRPNGPLVEVVRPQLDCLPCFEIDTHNCPEQTCLKDTTAAKVLTAFFTIYKT